MKRLIKLNLKLPNSMIKLNKLSMKKIMKKQIKAKAKLF